MSCNVAALPILAHAYYGTWSIDFYEVQGNHNCGSEKGKSFQELVDPNPWGKHYKHLKLLNTITLY